MSQEETKNWRLAYSEEYCLKAQTILSTKSYSHDGSVASDLEEVQEILIDCDPNHDVDSPMEIDEDNSLNPPSSSPHPSDSAHVLCRCGIESDGHHEQIVQDIVECTMCKRCTHMACLTNRQNKNIPGKFYCHICHPSTEPYYFKI